MLGLVEGNKKRGEVSGLLMQVESQPKDDVREVEMDSKSALLREASSQRRFFGP